MCIFVSMPLKPLYFMTIKICMFVVLKSTAENPPHHVCCVHVCVESAVQSTLSDSAGAFDESVKSGLNMMKGIRKTKKKVYDKI